MRADPERSRHHCMMLIGEARRDADEVRLLFLQQIPKIGITSFHADAFLRPLAAGYVWVRDGHDLNSTSPGKD